MNAAALTIAREALLRNPSLINGRAAALRLLSATQKCSPVQAEGMLASLKTSGIFADLFQTVLPKEFKLDRGSRAGIRERFYAALGFPLSEWLIAEWVHLDENLLATHIPIESLNGHLCENCANYAEMPLNYQLPILLFRGDAWEFDLLDLDEDVARDKEEWQWQWGVLAKKYKLPNRLAPKTIANYSDLKTVFQRERSPIRFLPLMYRLIRYNTGSIFLDFDPNDEPPEIEWSADNITGLRRDYKLARQIENDCLSFEKWLRLKPRPRIMKVLRLYHKAQQLTDAKTRRRVADAARGTLVRIL